MRVDAVDERDIGWEEFRPVFRVYLFHGTGSDEPPWTSSTVDITDADVLDAVGWAQSHVGDGDLYAVALVGSDGEGRRGLTWLVGTDANSVPLTGTEEALHRRMRELRDRRIRLEER
jgi:hypothetical protein